VPGAILNAYFLSEARRVKQITRAQPSGMDALTAMMWLFVYVPVSILGVMLMIGLLGAMVVAITA